MSLFDFPTSTPPAGMPLQRSHCASQIEAELQAIFLELFARVGKDTFDASVLGAAHLGSFELVRKMVNHDGLVLLAGEREEAATRYLYRAWKSGDIQKRGLHFVRTYLQLLFPEQAQVRQLWHYQDKPYGSGFVDAEIADPQWYPQLGKGLRLDGSWRVGRPLSLDAPQLVPPVEDAPRFLTSRIEILLGLDSVARPDVARSQAPSSTAGLIEVIRAVVPARLVPVFRFWIRFVLALQVRATYAMRLEKAVTLRYVPCGKVISTQPDVRWRLGRDGAYVTLPQPMGSFRVGEQRGQVSHARLTACRVQVAFESHTAVTANAAISVQPPLLTLNKAFATSLRYQLTTTQQIAIDLQFPYTPRRLGRHWRLRAGVRLDGQRAVGEMQGGTRLSGFRLRGDTLAVEVDMRQL
ncbi:MAG: hypothetical protein ACRCYV_02500 [Aeromonas sp.]